MVALEWLRGGSRPAKRVFGGLLLGAIGVALLVLPQGGGSKDLDVIGACVLILASASWAWGSVISRSSPLPASPLLATSMEMIAGGVLILVVAVLAGELEGFSLAAVSGKAIVAWLYLVVFGSLVAFTAYIWLLGVTSIAKVGTYAYVNPIVAVVLGWAVLDEQITLRTVLAALVILLGVALVNIDWSWPRARAAEESRAA
jgi:drug/metabolite transporter (DMT)-like permease